jgi:hypothetical protein
MSTPVHEELPVLPIGKVSFQTSTANAWAASFLRHLHAEFDNADLRDGPRLMGRICQAAQDLFNERCHTLPDTQSRTVLGMCVLMLSAYRELSAELRHAGQAFDLLRRGFEQTYQAFIQNICKPMLLNVGRSPQMLSSMNFKAWSERMYAADRRRHGLVHNADITGYHHFFQLHDAPALTRIIQHADQAWIEAVATYGRSRLAEQRRTRASDGAGGGETGFVPFRFAPGGGGRAVRQPDVVMELQINTAATDRRGNPAAADRHRYWDGIDRRQSARRQDDGRIWA